jgi:hypothetical protein
MNMKFFTLPEDASPRLKAMHIAQLGMVLLTIIATFLTAVIPQKHKLFTFGLLYGLIFSSVTTTIIVRREQQAARTGALTKQKYIKYQVFKMIAATGLYIVAFIAFLASTPAKPESHSRSQGLFIGGVHINRYQGWILMMHFFNWVSLENVLNAACMCANKDPGLPMGWLVLLLLHDRQQARTHCSYRR